MTVERSSAVQGRLHTRQPNLMLISADGTMTKRRYELFDGMLVVRPAPMIEHQRAVARLMLALQQRCPRSLEVIPGPIAIQPTDDQSFAPDLVVVSRRRSPLYGPETTPPVLIAEVVDETSQSLDRTVKLALYATFGVDHYWIFDPSVPQFIAYERTGDRYKEVVTATGDERVGFDKPILVEICPDRIAVNR